MDLDIVFIFYDTYVRIFDESLILMVLQMLLNDLYETCIVYIDYKIGVCRMTCMNI